MVRFALTALVETLALSIFISSIAVWAIVMGGA